MKIDISYRTVIFTTLFLIFVWFLIQIREIIFLVFVSFIFMAAFKPLIEGIEKFRLPRIFAVFFIYLALIVITVFVGSAVFPPFVIETVRFAESLPLYLQRAAPFIKMDIQVIAQQIAPVGENILRLTVNIFNNIFAIFTIIVISFYFSLERKNLEKYLSEFIGHNAMLRFLIVINKVEERLGAWVRGQFALMMTIGVMTYIGLTLLSIPYAIPLSIIAGILETIPNIGPIISAIPSVVIAFTITPMLSLATVLLYTLIQQAENHIVVPMVMRKAVGLSPVITIIAIMIGARLGGVAGAIMAVPIFVTVQSVFSEYMNFQETSKKNSKTNS